MKGVPLDDITRAPFVPPVDPSKFASLFMLLGTIGIAFTMWFFVYEVSVAKNKRSFIKELVLAIVSAVVLGFAFLFLLLWAGLWV